MAMLSVEREITALQQDKQYSGMQKDIFAIVSKVLPPDTSLRPSQATDAIDNLFPKAQSENKTISEKDTEDFLWAFWNVLIDVVQAVHSLHFGHVEIIKLVENLSRKSHGTVTIWGNEHRLWVDLPLLGPCMRERWIPHQLNRGTPDNEAADKWESLNSFAARLYGKGLMQWRNFAVWELRSALEEEVDEDTLEYRISIVKEWILHAGTRIFEEARTMYSDDSDVLKPGSLYKGPPGLNLQRWNFWKTRLATISRQSPGAVSIRAEAILWLMKHPEV